jgi:hypothetical protein
MIGGIGNLRTPGFYIPVEIRADISASLAANLAGESGLDIGQPNVILPLVAADRGPMAALVIRATDQQTAYTGSAHFGEGDFLAGELEHSP